MILFDIPSMEEKLKKLEKKTLEEGFWNDTKTSGNVLQEIKNIKAKYEKYQHIQQEIQNLMDMNELLNMD